MRRTLSYREKTADTDTCAAHFGPSGISAPTVPTLFPVKGNASRMSSVKYWEIIADNLKKAGWSLGYVSAVDCEGRTIWIADAHRDGKRFRCAC